MACEILLNDGVESRVAVLDGAADGFDVSHDQRRGGGQCESARGHAQVFVDAHGIVLVDKFVFR